MVSEETLASTAIGVGLIAATLALAWFTRALTRMTGQLKELEVQRDAREGRQRRYHRV